MPDPRRPMKPCPNPDCEDGYVTPPGKPWAAHHCPDCRGTGHVLDEDAFRAMMRADAERARVLRDAEQAVVDTARVWRDARGKDIPTSVYLAAVRAHVAAVDALAEIEGADRGV